MVCARPPPCSRGSAIASADPGTPGGSSAGLLPTAMGSSPALRGGSGCPCGDLGEGAWGGGRQRSALRAAPVFMRCSAQAVLFAFFH